MNLHNIPLFVLLSLILETLLIGSRSGVGCTTGALRGQTEGVLVKLPAPLLCNFNCNSLGNSTNLSPIRCSTTKDCAKNNSISFDCRTRRRRHGPILNCLRSSGKSPGAKTESCGKLSPTIVDTSIQNGITVNASSWPWHASIFRSSGPDTTSPPVFVCSGTLVRIHRSYKILTAAHCVTDSYGRRFPIENYRIVLGSHLSQFEMAKSQEAVQISSVSSIMISENYNIYTYDSDIAVLSIPPVKLTQFVQPICIQKFAWENKANSTQGKLPMPTFGYTTGFGINQFVGISKQLKQAIVPFVEKSTCENVSRQSREVISESQFCGGELHGMLICQGNSGSGLYSRKNPKGHFVLVGIVSHTLPSKASATHLDPPRCNPEKYTVFTNVSYFVDWIKTVRSY